MNMKLILKLFVARFIRLALLFSVEYVCKFFYRNFVWKIEKMPLMITKL